MCVIKVYKSSSELEVFLYKTSSLNDISPESKAIKKKWSRAQKVEEIVLWHTRV